MAISKMTTNVNNHQALPDKPALSAEELKILFDKASADIKEYINNTMLPEIDSLIAKLEKNKIEVNKIINNIETGGASNVASAELVKSISENINDIIENIKNSKLDKTGGTLTGNLSMGICKILFSNDGNIEWKENGYGDKFRIIPNFSGADDGNILKIQGAVGGAGTNPDFVDLFTITAKNGNISIKGIIEPKGGFKGKWYSTINDIGTENTKDSWLLVMNGNSIQHRTIQNIIGSYLKSGATTKITSGSSNPSGGNNGDVYIQYF